MVGTCLLSLLLAFSRNAWQLCRDQIYDNSLRTITSKDLNSARGPKLTDRKKKFSLTLCGWSSLLLRVRRSRTLVVKMTTNTGSYLVEGSTLRPLSLRASFKRAGKTLFPSLILALASYLLETGKIPGAHRGPAPSLYLVLPSGFNSSKTGCVIICLLRPFSAATYDGIEPSGGEDDGARLSTHNSSSGLTAAAHKPKIQRDPGHYPFSVNSSLQQM